MTIIISRLTLLGKHFPKRNRPFKLLKSQETHTNCVTVVMFEFRGNVWEYWKGSYYCDMRWILLYKVQIDIFLPEMLCIVVFAAENGELKQFEGFYIQSFDILIYFLLNSNITTCSHTIWVGALCPNLLFSSKFGFLSFMHTIARLCKCYTWKNYSSVEQHHMVCNAVCFFYPLHSTLYKIFTSLFIYLL